MRVTLTQNKVALIDDSHAYISHKNWHAIRSTKNPKYTWYAARRVYRKGTKSYMIYMHIEIMEHILNRPLKKDEEVDHKNNDGLDNRSENLRIATHSQNLYNQRIRSTKKTSQYKGVCWDKERNKWSAQINMNKKQIHIGRFESERDAAIAYDTLLKTIAGTFARLNFPED
jgi:hypothetical protein